MTPEEREQLLNEVRRIQEAGPPGMDFFDAYMQYLSMGSGVELKVTRNGRGVKGTMWGSHVELWGNPSKPSAEVKTCGGSLKDMELLTGMVTTAFKMLTGANRARPQGGGNKDLLKRVVEEARKRRQQQSDNSNKA